MYSSRHLPIDARVIHSRIFLRVGMARIASSPIYLHGMDVYVPVSPNNSNVICGLPDTMSYPKYAFWIVVQQLVCLFDAMLSSILTAFMGVIGLPTGSLAPYGFVPKNVWTVFAVIIRYLYFCLQYVSGHRAVQIAGRAKLQLH